MSAPKVRRGLSLADKAALFKRYKRGERLTDIAQLLGRSPGYIYGVLERHGGFPPPERKRSERMLSARERDEIFRGAARGDTIRSIAAKIGRAPSTVSREVSRNGGAAAYSPTKADQRAWDKARRPKDCKLAADRELAAMVASKLQQDWSPQQISGWLRTESPQAPEKTVSHETIYKTLFVQARGALKKELVDHLRRSRGIRRPKTTVEPKSVIPDAISIRQRPAEVEDRAVPGTWEGDLVAGFNNQSFIGTLVERQTRFVKLVKVDSKNAAHVAEALTREVLRLPEQLRQSLTWDRGTEMAKHKDFSVDTKVAVYFCDPHSPWQRGSNENTNGLLRQYFPKGMPLSGFSQDELDAIAAKLNGRPRMTLGWQTPARGLVSSLRRPVESALSPFQGAQLRPGSGASTSCRESMQPKVFSSSESRSTRCPRRSPRRAWAGSCPERSPPGGPRSSPRRPGPRRAGARPPPRGTRRRSGRATPGGRARGCGSTSSAGPRPSASGTAP